jgi:hypothetical protein
LSASGVNRFSTEDGKYACRSLGQTAVDALTTGHIYFAEAPSEIVFGELDGPFFSVRPPAA